MVKIKNIGAFLFFGIFLKVLSFKLKSPFLTEFLETNLIMLLIALLAINITTLSLILTKLQDLKSRYNYSFDSTINEMKKSIKEQICLITIAGFMQICSASELSFIKEKFWEFTIHSILAAILIFAVSILYDTASSAFTIIEFESKED